MAREVQEVSVDGTSYTITKMDPFKSLRLLTRLTKVVGPAAGKALGDPTMLEADVASEGFAKVIGELADRLDENQMEATAKELLAVVLRDGKTVNPIVDFGGDVPHMLRVMAEVLKAEYGGFLPLFSSLASNYAAAKES